MAVTGHARDEPPPGGARPVWPSGRRLTGPAQDLYLIAARTARPA